METLPAQAPVWADEGYWQEIRELQAASRAGRVLGEQRRIALEVQSRQRLLARSRLEALEWALRTVRPEDVPIVSPPPPPPVAVDLVDVRVRFGRLLRRRRGQAGLSQRKLDARCRFGQGKVSALERARTTATLPTICALAEALGTTPNELLRGL